MSGIIATTATQPLKPADAATFSKAIVESEAENDEVTEADLVDSEPEPEQQTFEEEEYAFNVCEL